MLHIIGCMFLLGIHLSDFVSARAIQCNIRNFTAISSSTRIEDPHRTSAISSQATVASEAERHSQTKSTDDRSPSVLQSALYTARPSGAITLAISRPCVRVEPQSCSVFGARPLDLVPGGSSGLLSRHASVLSSHLPTGTDRFLPVTTPTIIQSTAGPSNLLLAFGQLATSSRPDTLFSKGSVSTMSAVGSAEATQNALSVLLAALPSDVASSIEAGFSVVTQQLFATSETIPSTVTTRPTSLPSSVPTILSTSRSEPVPQSSKGPSESERPTSNYTARPTTQQDEHTRPTSHRPTDHTSSPESRPTSHPVSRPTGSHDPHRPTTLATLPILSTTQTSSQSTSSISSSLTPSSTTGPESSEPTISPQRQQANGTIAGVATGAAAGAVLIVLAIFFFLRRRQRKRSLKAVEENTSQPFPEVAWLYDPVRSPPRAQSPAPQNAEAAGILAVAQGQSKRNSAHAPEVVMPEGEPLLAPGRAATRDNSPGGNGRDRSVSPGDAIR